MTNWQKKATFEHLSKVIPGFSDIKTGESKQYFDKEGELHFEVKASVPNNQSYIGGLDNLIERLNLKLGGKPQPQINQVSKTVLRGGAYFLVGLIDAFCQYTMNKSLHNIINNRS